MMAESGKEAAQDRKVSSARFLERRKRAGRTDGEQADDAVRVELVAADVEEDAQDEEAEERAEAGAEDLREGEQ